jgi:hypothetical protein
MRQGIQSELNDAEVREYGCYALCLIAWAEHEAKKTLSDADVLEAVDAARKRGWLGPECYVANGAALYNYVRGEREYAGVTARLSKPPDEDTYIICNKKPMYTHFTAVLDGVLWDPLPPYRPAAAAYKPASYRILS